MKKSEEKVPSGFRFPIGVFDSGLGGLTIVKEIRRRLPQESIIYFGDLARLPYGTKSQEQILQFSTQNTFFLLRKKIKALVIACNSSASAAYDFIQKQFKIPVIDVIEPAAEYAAYITKSKRVGLIATHATIESGAYARAFSKYDPEIRIVSAPCPLFVPLVEEGWLSGKITREIAEFYLAPIKKEKVDVLVLGCTHYPMLAETLQQVMGPAVTLVDSIAPTISKLDKLLQNKHLDQPRKGDAGKLDVYVSDKPRSFIRLAEKFLGEKLDVVRVVRDIA